MHFLISSIAMVLFLLLTAGNVGATMAGKKIGIDPGHGGAPLIGVTGSCEYGATGPSNLREADVNLTTALAAKKYFERDGATVWITRTVTCDPNLTLSSRTNYLNSYVGIGGRTISIHHNSVLDQNVNSTMDFVYCGYCYSTSGNLAEDVIKRLGTSTGLPLGPAASTAPCAVGGYPCDGRPGVGQANLHMVRETSMPAILTEVSFISNPSEESKLRNPSYLDMNGWANYAGTADHFGTVPLPSDSTSDTAAPTVSISSPCSSSCSSSSSSISISGTATDSGGSGLDYVIVSSSPSGSSGYQYLSGNAATFSISGISLNQGQNLIGAKAFDKAGNSSNLYTINVTYSLSDTTPPTTPGSLSASAISSSQINLNWSASSDSGGSGLAGYKIERCMGIGCTSFSQIATTTSTSYSNTGLSASTTYTYRVRAYDNAGNNSGYSNTAAATTQAAPDTIAPTVPGSLYTSAVSSSQINLSWSASTDSGGSGLAGYKIERCTGSGCTSFSQIATTTSTSYSDTGLSASTTYTYRVRAYDNAGNHSGYSNTAVTTTQTPPDTTPPTGSITINSGAIYTNSTSVALTLAASDSSGVSQMCISNTSFCSSWETYATSKSWTLSSGDGTKTVYAWFKDSIGNANTSPYSDTITLDTTAPTDGTLSASPGNGQILLSWSGFSDTTSGISSYKLVYSTSSVPSSCSTGTEIYSGPNTSYTHTGLVNGTNYHYRICAIDNAGNSSTGKTAVATPEASDTTPPSGSITINSGAAYTNSISATLTLSCTDASGCSQMQFSNDNTNWSTAEAYAASKIWTLSNGDGTKMVYVKFKDGAGNWSSAYSNSIILDTVAPANGALTATAGNTSVALSWSGFSDATSGIGSYKLVYGTSGSPSSCATGTQLYSGSGASYTHTGLSNGTTYYYRICATDNAGNISEGATTSAIPIAPDGVSIPPSDTGITGVEREDGGSDSTNLDASTNKPRIDITYNFGIVIKDPTGNPPQYARLYMTDRSNPTASNFYSVELTCTGSWAYGATCNYATLLGPAPNHKYYFEAKLADGSLLRYPSTGEIAGPVVELLTGYNMVSIPRDTNGANMDSSTAFGNTQTYKWVSTGLTGSANKGSYVLVDSNNPVKPGEGYFTMKGNGITTLPEHGTYTDTLSPTYEITLNPGWNMISNPYGGNVKLSNVTVQKGSNTSVSWTDAAASGYVVNAIYYYKGSDWGSAYTFESAGGSPDAILVPWFGYWVYLNKNDDTYKLVITRP